MIVTEHEQIKLVNNFDYKTTKELDAFVAGMKAMMELIDTKLKNEK